VLFSLCTFNNFFYSFFYKHTQIKILKKEAPTRKETTAIPHQSEFNVELIPALAQTLLITQTESDQFQFFQKIPIKDSAHACFRKKTNLGQYTVVISNTLEGNNAVVSNCILRNIIIDKIEKHDGQLKKIIHQSYQFMNEIINENKILILNSSGFAVIILFQYNENNEVHAVGLNQHLYVLENNPLINPNQKPEYQSYYLQGNQELKYDDVKGIIAFSPNVYEKINQQELLKVLNEILSRSNDIGIEQLANDQLKSINDLLIVKISFQ